MGILLIVKVFNRPEPELINISEAQESIPVLWFGLWVQSGWGQNSFLAPSYVVVVKGVVRALCALLRLWPLSAYNGQLLYEMAPLS